MIEKKKYIYILSKLYGIREVFYQTFSLTTKVNKNNNESISSNHLNRETEERDIMSSGGLDNYD